MDKNRKHVLVITYFTNEDGMACSHHIDDRLFLLRHLGMEPILLSALCVPRHKEFMHTRVVSCAPSGIRFEMRQFFRRKARVNRQWKSVGSLALLPVLPFYALEKCLINLDTTWYWQPLAIWQGKRICRRHNIDLIYSTGGPVVAHSVAHAIHREYPAKWLAEVQDPLIHGYCAKNERELKLLRAVESRTYRDADRMIFLTSRAMEKTEERVGIQGRGAVIYPGAAPRTRLSSAKKSGGRFTVAHFGSLGGVRNLASLLTGLEMALKKNPLLAQKMNIDFFGNVGEDDLARIKASQCRPMVTLKGLTNRQHSLNLMFCYDILLLIQGCHDISVETIPCKLYEYLQSGSRVLGLVYRNPELEQMLNQLGHIAIQVDDVGAIAASILKLFSQWQRSEVAEIQSSPYTVRRAVTQLLEL